MHRTVRTAASFILAVSASVTAPAAFAGEGEGKTVKANVVGAEGNTLGMVTLEDTPAGLLVTTDITGLPEGDHAFHFHEKGMCDPGQKFTTAGGHFAPHQEKHGLMVMGGPHGGDMPNQHVGADGKLKAQVLNTRVTLSPGATSLLDADGSALVIHAGADDYKSQPSGDAGGRIACAVISAGE